MHGRQGNVQCVFGARESDISPIASSVSMYPRISVTFAMKTSVMEKHTIVAAGGVNMSYRRSVT